jgi:aryl-alcohol dehydrogenase-like predicted oxidoreductase
VAFSKAFTAKLGLGSAQFGFDYGISNRSGQTPPQEVERILCTASRVGITTLDTAAAYGVSEEVIGALLPMRDHPFEIVSKLSAIGSEGSPEQLSAMVFKSLRRLNQKSIYALLMHSTNDLLSPAGKELFAELQSLKHQKLVSKIGASVYEAAEIDALLERYDLELVQIPLNVFDQRLLHSGHLEKLKRRGVEVHARSVFLQGLLLMTPEELPPPLVRQAKNLRSFLSRCQQNEVSPACAALSFVLEQPLVDKVICGVNDESQLFELIAICKTPMPDASSLNDLACHDTSLIDPRTWSKQSLVKHKGNI